MRYQRLLIISFFAFATFINAQTRADEKIEDAADVIRDIQEIEETIPAEIVEDAKGLIIVPNLLNAGFVIGGKRGKGLALIKQENGSWSNPVFVSLTGGSVGFQAGVQKIDLILVFKKTSTLTNLGKSDFTLGGEISVAAGPVGRNSSAKTNDELTAEVYSYSRSRGLFAGISIDGAVIKVTDELNRDFYGKRQRSTKELENKNIVDNEALKELHELLGSM